MCLRVKINKLFFFKGCIPKELTSGVVYNFHCGLCNESYYGDCLRHLNVKIREQIWISPLTKKKVMPKGSEVTNHLLLCNHSQSFGNFTVLTEENRTFVLELKVTVSDYRRLDFELLRHRFLSINLLNMFEWGWWRDIAIVLRLVITLILISFCFFSSFSIWLFVFNLED